MTAEVGRISFSPIATTVITRSLDVFNNIHEASYVGNYQCVFTVSSNPCEENLACPHRAGVLETAAAFKADFMRRRFKIPIPGSWPILRSLLSRTNPSRLPRTEKRLDRSSTQDTATVFLSRWPSIDPFPSHPLLLFLSAAFPRPIARLSMLSSPRTMILASSERV